MGITRQGCSSKHCFLTSNVSSLWDRRLWNRLGLRRSTDLEGRTMKDGWEPSHPYRNNKALVFYDQIVAVGNSRQC